MTTKHTPGPWRPYKFGDIQSGNWNWCVTQSPEDARRNLQLASVNHTASNDAEADARLIAAAPDLLAALIRLRDCPDVQMECTEPETDAAREYANAIIAKAEGAQ